MVLIQSLAYVEQVSFLHTYLCIVYQREHTGRKHRKATVYTRRLSVYGELLQSFAPESSERFCLFPEPNSQQSWS